MWCWGAGALFLLHQCIIVDLRCRRSRYHGGERRTRVGSRYRVVLGSRGTVPSLSVYHCRFEMSKEPISWRGAENTSRKQISCGAGEQGHCSYFISVSCGFEMSKEPISCRGAENMSRKQIKCGAGEQGHCSYFSVSLYF